MFEQATVTAEARYSVLNTIVETPRVALYLLSDGYVCTSIAARSSTAPAR